MRNKFFISMLRFPNKCEYQKMLDKRYFNRNRINRVIQTIEKEFNKLSKEAKDKYDKSSDKSKDKSSAK
tara:strand:+ start:1688 stop:1894 length:207 start_codon:yes stop_codon:yes gene_type:complete